MALAEWSCGRDAWWKKMPHLRCMLIQLHSRDILRTKLWPQYRYPQTFRGASDKAKNRHPPGRTETEGIAKLSRPFDTPGPHWSQTFQTRHMTRWIEQNPSSNTATATQPRWGGFGWNLKKKCDQIIPAHEKYFKRDGHRYMRAHLRKNANQKCQLYVKSVAKRPSCWYWTN